MKRKTQCLFAILVIAVLIAALAVTLVACGNNNDTDGGGEGPSTHEHSYSLVEAKEPTCTQGGNEEYYVCDECNKYFNSGKQLIDAIPTLPANGHSKVLDNWETDGTSHWHKCLNCEEKFDFDSHKFNWEEDSEATCLQKATHHQKCSTCYFETQPEEYGEFGEHEYSRTDAQSPTCTEDGNEEYYTCDLCQKYFDSALQQIDDVPTIPASGHERVMTKWETDGTSHWRACRNCDEKVDLDSHEFGGWIDDGVEATCLQKATHHKECPICEYRTKSEPYGEFGEHNYNLTDAKEPTCTEDGNYEYYTCDVCNNYFDSQRQQISAIPTRPANGHSKVLDSWETDGTSHWHKCLNCEEKFDFDSHKFNWEEDSEATCLQKATHHQKCSTCYFETQPEEYGEFGEHEYSKTEAKTPTCTEDGNEEYYSCDVCNKYFDSQYKQIDEIPTLPAGHDKVTDSWQTDDASHWRKCKNCDEQLELDEHKFGEWTIDNADYTCGDTVTRHRDCPTCGYSQKEEDYIVPHIWNSDTNQCDTCGKVKPYIEAGEENKLFFGEYPQTNVTNDSTGLIATLSQMAGDRPVKGNRGKWTDYGYYMGEMQTGSAAKPVKTEYMWYIDLEYGGAKYRGVYFTSYRPDSTYTFEPSPTTAYQSKNGYTKDYVHWFKWEPIKWRVLTSADGEAFLMSDVILDSQPFYHDTGIRKTDDGMTTIYSNNYKESDIRAWLNKEFYEWAFDTTDQSIIKQTLVDNSPATTDSAGKNQYTCEDTLDYVFLLSYSDVTNPNYIPQDPYPLDKNLYCGRALNPTDYAESQGLSVVNNATNFAGYQTLASWWLRSPFNGDMSHLILNKGNIMTGGYVAGKTINTHWIGVVPALWITL